MRRLGSIALAVLAGCSSLGEGSIALRVGAERAAIEGIPHGEIDFVDGWRVTFARYLVSIADIEIATSDGDVVRAEGPYVVDLHAEEPEVDVLEGLAGRRWDEVAFSVRAPGGAAPAYGDDADAAMLDAGAYNSWIEGTGTHPDGRVVSFAWGLANPTRMSACVDGTDGKPGVVVRASKTTTGEVTLHVEHLFWDRLGSEQTQQRFEAIAAMADEETGVVAWEALAEQAIADLRDACGNPLLDENGAPLFYDPGSAAVTNLQEFMLAATSTQAHWNGEGLCTVAPL